ncbi:hypothetical protein [Mesonia aestuariivivens]|uniref:DUF4840 domain-containing protein n=1 Tax=Mesonia aestuariivivens TaxID=2796128 RepID=A0ABS6W0D8_9FLAO|nr:hypothetical protein [Mesonia aestuariivivens]MBW2961219.1 hypothetical protein [Mesonia aestuariivivens]
MKKTYLFLPVLFMTILFSSCSDDDDVVDRLRTISDIPINAEVSIDYLPINIFEIPVEKDLDLRQLIENELGTDETLDQVEEVELDDMDIVLVSANDQENFDFINSVTLGIRTDDLEYKEVATLDEIPSGATTLDLNTIDGVFIDEYAKSESLKLVIKFESTEDASNLNLNLKMQFDAKLDPSL